MAGILLYTSAPDAEGTLGGLVNLGKPAQLSALLAQAAPSSEPDCAAVIPCALTTNPTLDGSLPRGLVSCSACSWPRRVMSEEQVPRPLDLVDTFAHTAWSSSVSNLADAAAAVASQLASRISEPWRRRIAGEARHTKSGAAKVAGVSPSPGTGRSCRTYILGGLPNQEPLPGSAIALALEAAASMEASIGPMSRSS
ncbi:MAG: hypothetical protein R2755_23515 [Acidimicrobiales bacterium]